MAEDVKDHAGILDALREIIDTAGADKVFGAPISHDGVIVLPVATVRGGGGGGGGSGPGSAQGDQGAEEASSGAGGGFGVEAKPLGVFVIKNGEVTWRPALDVGKVILAGQLVAVAALLVIRSIVKARRSRRQPVQR